MIGWLVAHSALYGFAVGLSNGVVFAVRNTVKLAMLILSTAAICSLCYHVLARFLAARLSLVETQRIVLAIFADASRLLAAISPVVVFLALTMAPPDETGLGGFPQFMAFNVIAIAMCGSVAVRQQSAKCLSEALDGARPRRTLVAAWLVSSLVVGGQMSWLIRPFFGVEGAADWDWDWFTGFEPGFRGARSFFEAVFFLIVPPSGGR